MKIKVAGAPKISAEEVRVRLNGVYSGSTDQYWFWESSISSGSLWDIISGSDIYLRDMCGESVWDDTDPDTVNKVKRTELNYACFKTLVILSGGVIVDGFVWATGPIRMDPRYMFAGWRNLIEEFGLTAQNNLRSLQTFVLDYEWDEPSWGKTATSVM